MKTGLLTIVLLSLLPGLLPAEEPALRLEAHKKVYDLKEKIVVTLHLTNMPVSPTPPGRTKELYAASETIMPGSTAFEYRTEFKSSFSLNAEKLGEQVLGPYSIQLGDKTLTSGTQTIRVIASMQGTSRIFMTREHVKKGESFDLIMESTEQSLYHIKWKDNPLAKCVGTSYSSNTQWQIGQKSSRHLATFNLVATQSGQLTVTRDSFSKLPEGLHVGTDKLQIE